MTVSTGTATAYFNPRSPQGGATANANRERFNAFEFQSTLPARGSDLLAIAIMTKPTQFQSTLPARGSDRDACLDCGQRRAISIHAPRKGERLNAGDRVRILEEFQSTLPARGSDCAEIAERKSMQVFQSTLPARGSDHTDLLRMRRRTYFNPRSPRGGATT